MMHERPRDPRSRLPRPTVGVSVALCTHNGARWLPPFLRSVADQDRLPDELIVHDDCSADDTVQLLHDFARSAPFPVRVTVNSQRLGSTANFAATLADCRGRFIALADQDDIWYPRKLALLIETMESDPTVTMVFSNADLVGEDGRRMSQRLWDTRLVGRVLRSSPVVSEELLARRALTTGCTMAVRRRAVEAALPFPAILTNSAATMRHDRWLSLVAAAVGTVRALPEPLLGFRVHPDQETGVLVEGQLARSLTRTAIGILTDRAPDNSAGLEVRAMQLEAAAERADQVGDFSEANTLRHVASLQRLRLLDSPTRQGRLHAVAHALRAGAYDRDLMGAAAVVADTVRAAGPGRRTGRSTDSTMSTT